MRRESGQQGSCGREGSSAIENEKKSCDRQKNGANVERHQRTINNKTLLLAKLLQIKATSRVVVGANNA